MQSSEMGFTTSPPTLAATLAATGYTDMMTSGPMLGSPDSGLSTDNHMRPIVSHDYSSAFLPATNTTMAGSAGGSTLSDQLGTSISSHHITQVGLHSSLTTYHL